MKTALRTAFDSLLVVKLGHSDWRICEAAQPDRVLGYIERQRAGRFEVMWMTDPMRWGYANSFDSALLAFGDSVRFSGEIVAERAVVGAASRAPVTRAHRETWVKPGRRARVA